MWSRTPGAVPDGCAHRGLARLSTRCEEFRVRWAAHNVRLHRTGVKRFHHQLVGDLTMSYEALELSGDPGQTVFAYTAEPHSPSHDAEWLAERGRIADAQPLLADALPVFERLKAEPFAERARAVTRDVIETA